MSAPQPMGTEPVAVMTINGQPRDIDASLAPIVEALNAAGLATVACCSGHGHRPGNIALADGREIIIARDFAEARRIDALFPIGANGEPIPPPVPRLHAFNPHSKWPWFCADCGYAPHEPLKHFQPAQGIVTEGQDLQGLGERSE